MIRAVLFDFDDTLVDTFNSKIPPIIEYCASVHGVTVTHDEVKALWGMPFWEKMRALSKSSDIDTERYLSISEKYPLAPFPESRAVLASLQSRLDIGIVTSLARPVLLHSLKVLGWHDLRFSTLVTEGDAPANKPDPRVFGPALTSLPTVKAHEILYVGDAMTDAQAASQAGLMFIGIARDPERQAAFRNGGFQYQTTLSDIDRAVRPRELQP
jgi:beta-phosphoglucomutase-like phosphatase (HAD superfamily)